MATVVQRFHLNLERGFGSYSIVGLTRVRVDNTIGDGSKHPMMSTMICDSNAAVLRPDEIRERLSRLKGWSLGENWIEKTYRFKNFLRAMSFVNAVAYAAESVNHHPDLMIHYNKVTVRNWTHVAGGLTEYDFLLAEKIDELAESRRIASDSPVEHR